MRRLFDRRFSNVTFGPGSPVVLRKPGSYVNVSTNGRTRDPRTRLNEVARRDLPAAVAGPAVVAPVLPTEPRPSSEKSVMSLAGGLLVIVGVIRSIVPVIFTV